MTTAKMYRATRTSPLAPLLPLVVLCLWLTSCTDITSLYPLYESKNDYTIRDELVGVWTPRPGEGESGEYAAVQLGADSVYRLLVVHKSYDSLNRKDTNHLLGVLVQAGDYLFLDCTADPDYLRFGNHGAYALMLMHQSHFICRVKFRNQNREAELHYLSAYKLEEVLKKHNVPYYTFLWDMLLMEPSPDLKKLLVQLAKDHPKVWERQILVRRDQPPARSGGAAKAVMRSAALPAPAAL